MPGVRKRNLKKDQILAVDLGSQVTKAVLLQRTGKEIRLRGYVLKETPSPENLSDRHLLANHLKQTLKPIAGSCRSLVISLGSDDSFLSHADLPSATASDLRRMIRLSPKNYLQKELPNHVFDCFVQEQGSGVDDASIAGKRRRAKVLVGAAPANLVARVEAAAKEAGFLLQELTLSQVAMANAFRLLPSSKDGSVVALMDIGFRNTSISLVSAGSILLTRTVNIGAERFSDVNEPSAESASEEVDPDDIPIEDAFHAIVQRAITSLARELDASIGFFASQEELQVSQVFVSGGSARSQFILQTLQAELGLPCQIWSPTEALSLSLSAEKAGELDYVAPQLTVALGAGLGVLEADSVRLDMLAVSREALEEKRRDPVRRARFLSCVALAAMVAWAGYLLYDLWHAKGELKATTERVATLQAESQRAIDVYEESRLLRARVAALSTQGNQRSLAAPILNALQYIHVDGISFYDLRFHRTLLSEEVVVADERKKRIREQAFLDIQALNYGNDTNIPLFIDQLGEQAFFRERLAQPSHRAIQLTETGKQQIDTRGSGQGFSMFTIRCQFPEKVYMP